MTIAQEWLTVLCYLVGIPIGILFVFIVYQFVYMTVMAVLLAFLGVFDKRAEQRVIRWMERQ